MISIEFRFPAGRYHATPWNRQVNEGIVEWPPNPWRVIRALISTYYTKMKGDFNEEVLRSVIEKFSDPPVYKMPDASLGHTRHYMPLYHIGKSSLIFDTFASVGKDKRLLMSWPDVELDEREVELLSECLQRIQYLGRAESWVESRLIHEDIVPDCFPFGNGENHDRDMEIIDVLVPMSGDDFKQWSVDWKKSHSGKKKDRIPDDMLGALCVDTTVLKRNGWSQPPGSRWVQYLRRSDCFDIKPENQGLMAEDKRPTVARYQVASQASPRLTDAISLAERVHTSLVKFSDQSSIFTGCDENKIPLKDHGHAHIFCESNRSMRNGMRGEVTHVTIFAPNGFGRKERKSLGMLRKVWGYGGHDVQLVLLGVGDLDDFSGMNLMAGQCNLFVEYDTWTSRTPFVSTTHPKFNRKGEPRMIETSVRIIGQENEHLVQSGSPEYDLLRLLKERGFPEPESIERIKFTDLSGHKTYWLDFRRDRNTGNGSRGPSPSTGFRIQFKEKVKGPIALGFGSHFGLGLFTPVDKEVEY